MATRIGALPSLLTVLLVSFGVILGFAVAAGELLALAQQPDGSTAFDSSITSWVVAHRTDGLTSAGHVLSTIGSQTVLLPLVAIAVVALLWRRELAAAGLLVAAWGGALLLYSLTKHFVQRPRPPSHLWLTNVGRSSSFPSGHATQSLATLLALVAVGAVWLPRMRWPGRALALLLAGAIGWSRVYLGVHWTTDVLAGWLIAAVWLGVVAWLRAAARSPAEKARVTGAVIRNG
ncbi:MAG TPA: phosphatase PAP2 family protein [Solirubrobacteraceae bacterium]